MYSLFSGLLGFVIGFLSILAVITINFKHNVVKAKVEKYVSLFSLWLKLRDEIYKSWSRDQNRENNSRVSFEGYGDLYSQSLSLIGNIVILSENDTLSEEIMKFNQKFFNFGQPSSINQLTQDQLHKQLDKFLQEGLTLAKQVRGNIKDSTILWRKDFFRIINGLFSCKQE